MFAGCRSLTGKDGTNLANAARRIGGHVDIKGALLARIDRYYDMDTPTPGYFST